MAITEHFLSSEIATTFDRGFDGGVLGLPPPGSHPWVLRIESRGGPSVERSPPGLLELPRMPILRFPHISAESGFPTGDPLGDPEGILQEIPRGVSRDIPWGTSGDFPWDPLGDPLGDP